MSTLAITMGFMGKSRNRYRGSPAGRKSTRAYHHGDLRAALVASACQLLEEKGVTALSLREVARRSGVSQAAPYRHFPDKASLLAAVAAEGFRGLSHSMIKTAAGEDDRVNRFRALGRGYVRFAFENAGMLRLMFGPEIGCKGDYPELREAAREAYAVLSGAAASVVGEQEPPATTALAAWSVVHGLSHLIIDGQVPVEDLEALDRLVDRVTAKVHPRG